MPAAAALDHISDSFMAARRSATALSGFPGTPPEDFATAYQIQDRSLRLWPDRVVGWKVGLVPPPLRPALGSERLVGPIFARNFWTAHAGAPTVLPVFQGGFAAVEAEFIIALAADLPASGGAVTAEEAAALAGAMHVGIEAAGSPLATINDLGPTVVVSDFGNNAGLILGPEIADWKSRDPASLTVRTLVDGVEVGSGSAASIPGTPLAAFHFLLCNARSRGIALRAGDLVSTGASTGIHNIVPGSHASVIFDGVAVLDCIAIAAQPQED